MSEASAGCGQLGLAVGAVVGKRKMAKHFDLTIGDAGFAFHRKQAEIAAEAALDLLGVFTRVFRHFLGVSPGSWRRDRRN